MILRRLILALCVLASAGCAVTQWQREQDHFAALIEQVQELHTPAMNAAIAEAQPGVPRGASR